MSTIQGLTSAEVRKRFARKQYNRPSKTKTKTIGEIFIENVLSVFNLIIGLIIIFFVIFYLRSYDSRLLLDAIGIFLVAFINTLISIYQEIKAKRILDKINLLLKKEVTVVRDGQQSTINQKNIVVDEVIYLQRGDQAVVDGRLLLSNHIEIDEALLTGESVPIHKQPGDQIFSGSFCLSGNGYYLAEKVGDDCYASEVTRLAKKYSFILTPLQKRINFFVKALFGAAIALVLLKILLGRNSNLLEIDSIREIGTILESLVPQGLVLMSSVTFAIGVYRISKVGAIVQKLNAVESFSNVQVTCMDKTGTLTKNKLTVQQVIPFAGPDSEENIRRVLGTYARLSSDKNATLQALEIFEHNRDVELIDEIPFNSTRKMSFIKVRKGNDNNIFALGAYDVLFNNLEKNFQTEATRLYTENRIEVYRNLLFGKASGDNSLEEIRNNPTQFTLEPLCIISITDKIREDAFEVINLFDQKGVEIKILSGDAPPAIQAVCREIGWQVDADEIISGNKLDQLGAKEFARVVRDKKIFGRLKPEHKLKIIKELRAQKIYTAMIGDGVNDLPAIKEADLGIAMEEGSAVTKEVADIILLKNRFSLLPKIFNEGNKVINTVGAIAKLFLTKNFLIIYLGLFSMLFLLEFPLTPRRVSLMNIFAIGLPSMIIAWGNENIEPYKNFMLDLFTFVGISGLLIAISGYIGFYLSEGITNIKHVESENVMIAIMTVLSIANYYAVVINKKERKKLQYMLYGCLMLLGYFVLLSLRSENILVNNIKMFYEIVNLHPQSWYLVWIVGLGSSIVFLLIQATRGWLLTRQQ